MGIGLTFCFRINVKILVHPTLAIIFPLSIFANQPQVKTMAPLQSHLFMCGAQNGRSLFMDPLSFYSRAA
jgi:hypothetical protein